MTSYCGREARSKESVVADLFQPDCADSLLTFTSIPPTQVKFVYVTDFHP